MESDPAEIVFAERPCLGIRFAAPYRGMFAVVSDQFRTLERWLRGRPSLHPGPRYLRYHVIDMAGTMQLEVGVFVEEPAQGEGPVQAGSMPAGRYARLVYRGLGLAANKRLLNWIIENGLDSDRTTVAEGDSFAARYEAYLTDPQLEPRKKQWDIELAIRLK